MSEEKGCVDWSGEKRHLYATWTEDGNDLFI